MSDPLNIPDAPPHLRNLLQRLPETAGGFLVSQHYHDPRPNEWFAGWNGGDTGPHSNSEEALFAGIRWLYRLYTEASEERDKAWDEIAALQAQLDQPDDGLDPWRKALDG